MRSVAAVAAVLLLAGCVGVEPLEPDTVALIPPQRAGMDAQLVGALRLGEDCVTVETPGGVVLPVFPSTAVAWEDGSLVVDGERYDDGDPIWLGGGGADVRSDMHIPEGCPTGTVFLVAG